jgi:hypothetical protein
MGLKSPLLTSVKSLFLLLVISFVFTGVEDVSASPCSDPMKVIKDFYDSTDSLQFDRSLSFFTADAELTTWAEGVNGRHWQETHYYGPDQIRKALNRRGLRRISENPNSPIFRETEEKVLSDKVSFMLRPDRLGPDQRPYNPYQVITTFDNCRIKTLTVIEYITWE